MARLIHDLTDGTKPIGGDDLLEHFDPISLAELNAKAAMLERLDNKYVVKAPVLGVAAAELARHFDILEIGERRAFGYETWYFDDRERRSYFDHHQGRRRRVKVRVRRYRDAKLCFVEVKLKDKRGITIKKRMPYPLANYGFLDEAALAHVERCCREVYGEPFGRELAPVLEVYYERMTLVAKQGGERMTIDNALRFSSHDESYAVDPELYIVETKSPNGNGLADKIFRSLKQHPTKHCSKYCVGTAATRGVDKFNTFMPAMRRLAVRGSGWAFDVAPLHVLTADAGAR